MIDTLLVIGNGFDKKCGLKSSFADFYNEWFKGQSNLQSIMFKFIHDYNFENTSKILDQLMSEKEKIKNEFSVWDLFFFSKLDVLLDSILWFDVEQIISDSFERKEKSNGQLIENFWDVFRKEYILLTKRPYGQEYDMSSRMKRFIYIVYHLEYTELSVLNRNNKDYEKLLYDFLKSELIKFEKRFRDYLQVESSKSEYLTEKQEFLEKLKWYKTNVLSFNYTHLDMEKDERIENVHGSIQSDCSIIGIDGSDFDDNNQAYIFTKTLRKIQQFTVSTKKSTNDILKPEIKKIIFYGHSLNKQDYAYFLSLFDLYDLSGMTRKPKISLEFYYSIYNGKSPEDIRRDAYNGVFKLINKYDDTFISNHKSGRNLLHKLLLENRILLDEI